MYERRMEERRRQEGVSAELKSRLAQETMMAANATSDERVEHMRANRAHKESKMRVSRAEAVTNMARRRSELEELRAQDAALATAISDVSKEALRREKMVQLVRESSHELRDLESKLKSAYVTKELSVQMSTRAADAAAKRQEQLAADRALAEQWANVADLEAEREAQRAAEAAEASRVLQEQMMAREEAKAAEYEEYLKERAVVDEIVARIEEEDALEAAAKAQKRAETQSYIRDFLNEREAVKAAEQEAAAKEEARIAQYMQQQADRVEAEVTRKRERDEQRSHLFDLVASEISRREADRDELEAIRAELAEEEKRAAEIAADREAKERAARQRMELLSALKEQEEIRAQLIEKEKMEEEKLRSIMLAKFEEDEKTAALSAEKRKRAKMAYRRELEGLIGARREAKVAAEREETERDARPDPMETLRREVVEQERRRLIQEHAANLIGFLPRGILSAHDLDLLPEDVRQAFNPAPPLAEDQPHPSLATGRTH